MPATLSSNNSNGNNSSMNINNNGGGPMIRKNSNSSKNSAQPAKKLVIKSLKAAPKLPENFEEETWKKLESAVRAVFGSRSTECSLEELYKAAEDSSHKLAPNLYKKLEDEIESHVRQEFINISNSPSTDLISFLNLIHQSWQNFCSQTILIRAIFLYLDRTYALQTPGIRSIWEMSLGHFKKYIISVPEIEKKLVKGLLSLIEGERRGENVDRLLLKTLIKMFVSLGMYQSFEKPFLESTNSFYTSEAEQCIREMEVAVYLKQVENRLSNESERVIQYLDVSTRKDLIKTVEYRMLECHVQGLINKGFDELMQSNRIEDLGRMYSLFSRVNALDQLKLAYGNYIKVTGSSMIEDPEKEVTLVQDLLDFKAKLDAILLNAFAKNENFAYTIKESFEMIINKKANRPAELIAKFVDSKLRAGNKGSSEEETEDILDRVMVLFRYIHGKDVFEAFYKKDLAKRLLLDKSASLDEEKNMISKLKAECGSGFTNKLEGMFKDIDLSSDIMSAFKDSPQYRNELTGDIDLNVSVLTSGYWPAYNPIEINLPQNLSQCQDVFKKFYFSKYQGRRLTWQNSLGRCTLKAFFPSGTKELAVSLLQTVVLLLFNNQDEFTFKEIHQATALEQGELKRQLMSLACGKVKVLTKSTQSKEVSEDDTFTYNKQFKQKAFRIKINAIQMKETAEENHKTTQAVMQDRQYQIDAAIVRIMKTRKTLSHSQLVSELIGQLKFPAKPADLKKRIESLIEREYLERSLEDSQIYNYLA